MKRDEVSDVLKRHMPELRQRFAVRSLALFGSVARDRAVPASDVDLIVEFNGPVGYFGLFALQDHLERLFGCKVDLGTIESLKPRLRERVLAELVDVA
jgi:hypothetical protein